MEFFEFILIFATIASSRNDDKIVEQVEIRSKIGSDFRLELRSEASSEVGLEVELEVGSKLRPEF